MTDRRVKEYLAGEGEKNYRYTKSLLNQIKEKKMNRAEAISEIDCVLFEQDHLNRKEVMKALKQPVTLAEFLGWEEGQEYEYGDRFIIEDNSLYKTYDIADDEEYKFKRIVEVDWSSGNIEWLRQAKKVEEPKYYAMIKLPEKVKTPPYLSFEYGKKESGAFKLKGWVELNEIDAMAKSEWLEYGITDDNVEFERAE